jgi:plastocyanin
MKSSCLSRHIFWCAATFTMALYSIGPSAAAGASKPATHTVTIDASRFEPEVLKVRAGDTVVWVNKDIVAHTATSQLGGFDSGMIVPGKSWTYRVRQTGEVAYICAYHPTMKATLRVD